MPPYVPSLLTDGKSQDRNLIDAQVEPLAISIVAKISDNFSVLTIYKETFVELGKQLTSLSRKNNADMPLANTIFNVGSSYGYQGAFLGELNYAVTRLIQVVPQVMVESGKWASKDEIRYWLYACTVEALIFATDFFKRSGFGIGGVFEDIKDEYKRRMNIAYEAAQIIKSGDCFDAPYYTRLIEVVDADGNLIGHQEVMLKRSPETLNVNVLKFQIVANREKVVSV